MADQEIIIGVLQLVALALPAFAILLEIVVESDTPYTYYAVPITTAGLGLFLVGGTIILVELLFLTPSVVLGVAMTLLAFGMICMLAGAFVIGLQTRREQFKIRND